MKIVEKRFRLTNNRWEGIDGFCEEGLAKVFVVPEGVKTIWLSLHDRLATNREPVKVGNAEYVWGPGAVQIRVNGWVFSVEVLDKPLFPFIGKTLYLQCEYIG